MKKNYEVFVKLEYDDVWSRKMKEMFLGNEVEICLIVDSDESHFVVTGNGIQNLEELLNELK